MKGGTLVVGPASLVGQWEGEVMQRAKKHLLDVEVYHGTPENQNLEDWHDVTW